jgi:type II secretory pathway component PulF
MPALNTPRRLVERAELYHQLASLTAAGVGLLQGIDHLRRNPPHRSLGQPLEIAARYIRGGSTFSEALRHAGDVMPSFDLALIDAGERSGRLDGCFRLLADYYRERAQMARRVISDLLYPVALLHFAVMIFPVSGIQGLILRGEVGTFILQKLAMLLPAYALVLLGIYLCQGHHSEGWRGLIEAVGHWVPLLGKARRNLALARLAAALEALINAGVSILEAWELGAEASGSPALRRAVRSWKPRLQAGVTPAETVLESPLFPELFASQYHTGELSGKLDETLRRLHQHYQEEATRQLRSLSQWAPKLCYLAIMLYIAWQIVQFWLGYFNQINQLL